jgi:hypothetical protein
MGPQERERNILPDDGGRLKQPLLLGWQPVDARGKDRLDRRLDLPRFQTAFGLCRRRRHPIGPPVPDEHLRLHQGPHALLEEEGAALGPLDQRAPEGLERRVLAQQGGEQLSGALGRQRIDPELGVVGLAPPGVLVLGTVTDEEQDACGREALDQAIEPRLALGVDPVEMSAIRGRPRGVPGLRPRHRLASSSSLGGAIGLGGQPRGGGPPLGARGTPSVRGEATTAGRTVNEANALGDRYLGKVTLRVALCTTNSSPGRCW